MSLTLILAQQLYKWCRLPLAKADYTSSPHVVAGNTTLYLGRTPDGALRIPLQSTPSKWVRRALVSFEDRYFDYHPGINPFSAIRALSFNLWHSQRLGASTISMQVARILDPSPRTYLSKLRETLRAIQLEWRFSKAEILQLWLNLTPYGGNVEGIETAAQLWFQKSSSALTAAEAAWLISLPKSPSASYANHHKNYTKVLQAMQREGHLSQAESAQLDKLRFPRKRQNVPFKAPHLSLQFAKPGRHEVFLNPRLQSQARGWIQTMLKKVRPLQAMHCAMAVVELNSFKLQAYIGSADFDSPGSRIDALRVPRSPGSLLKPFVYGLNYEYGSLHPSTKLPDTEVDFQGWIPGALENKRAGHVTSANALRYSLNVPAVLASQMVPEPRLQKILRLTVPGHRLQKHWRGSDNAVLGNIPVTVLEVLELYGILARQGKYAPLRISSHQRLIEQPTLLSPQSTGLITRILMHSPKPAMGTSKPMAYKTGTSNQGRDVWVAAYSPTHLLVAWAGRLDGQPTNMHSSYQTLLEPALDFLAQMTPPNKDFSLPSGLSHNPVCNRLAYEDPADCQRSNYELSIDLFATHEDCHKPSRGLRRSLLAQSANAALCDLPPRPLWVFPRPRNQYVLQPHQEKALVKLQCHSPMQNEHLQFQINQSPLQSIPNNKAHYLKVSPGIHELECRDSSGQSDSIQLRVIH